MAESSNEQQDDTKQSDGLDWTHKAVDIRDRRSFERVASDTECAEVSRIFGEAKCLRFETSYDVVPLAPGRYRVVGAVRSHVELICGVTLDPIEQVIDESFDIEFHAGVRSGLSQQMDHDPDFDALAEDDPEPLEHGYIRVGRFVCELVASAIDPFPRAPDAVLEQVESVDPEPTANPFAVLKDFKGRTQ